MTVDYRKTVPSVCRTKWVRIDGLRKARLEWSELDVGVSPIRWEDAGSLHTSPNASRCNFAMSMLSWLSIVSTYGNLMSNTTLRVACGHAF